MMTQRNNPNIYDSFSIRVNSPVGTYTIFFIESRPTGKLERIDINCGKAGSELRAWTASVGEMLSTLLTDGKITIRDVLKFFSSQRSDKSVRDDSTQIEITSGPEAIAFACQKYLTEKATQLNSQSNPLRVYGKGRNASFIPHERRELLADLRAD